MIPLKFGLFWSGTNLSYLRFLTFVSLRKYHPNAEIELYLSNNTNKDVNWRIEKQDFQLTPNEDSINYIDKLEELDVKVIKADLFPTYAPNYQSDLFRWWWLYNNGGFYLDTDQIVIRSFGSLPIDFDFICSIYNAKSCGIYSPVGVIGSKKKCPIVKQIMDEMVECYDANDYNSLGPFMFRSLFLENRGKWESNNAVFNAPPNVFYPIAESYLINKIYEEGNFFDFSDSYCVHWFGGHPNSQKFNTKCSEEFLKKSNCPMSQLLGITKVREYWENIRS